MAMVVVVGSVVAAPAAGASMGVLGYWGNPTAGAGTTGGLFSTTPGGVAVSAAGAGSGVQAGDVYVVDQGNNRVQQFRSDGAFVRAWGVDVVQTGKPNNVATNVFEICDTTAPAPNVAADCKAGTTAAVDAAKAGGLNAPRGIAIDQVTGNVIVSDQGNRRVDVFSSDGVFQGAFGWGVDTGAAAFQFCSTVSVCQAPAASGGNAGQFGAVMGHPAVAPAGAPNAGSVVLANTTNNRIDEFALTLNGSNVVTAAAFTRGIGWNVDTSGGSGELEICTTACQAGVVAGSTFATAAGLTRVAVDATGAMYAVNFPTGSNCNAAASRCGVFRLPHAGTDAPAFGGALLNFTTGTRNSQAATDVAVDTATGNVLVMRGFQIGTGSPPASTPQRRILEFDAVGAPVDVHLIDSGINVGNGLAFDPPRGRAYFSSTTGAPRIYALSDDVTAPTAAVEAATDVTSTTATLHGSVGPAEVTPVIGGNRIATSYRFEYSRNGSIWTKAPAPDVSLGTGTDGGSSSTCPTPQAATCVVSQAVSGLDPNRTYQLRIVASTAFNGASTTVTGPRFTTPPLVPDVQTGVALWSSPADTRPSLMLSGRLNPRHAATSYYFEYVEADAFAASGFSTAARTPLADAGSGTVALEVRDTVLALDPSVTYRYRLVASNVAGVTEGPTLTVAPPDDGDRFYELVSVGDSWGLGIQTGVRAIADSGDRALFNAQAFGTPNSVPSTTSPYVSSRTASGWRVGSMLPAPETAESAYGLANGSNGALAPDLTRALWAESTPTERLRGVTQFMIRSLDGTSNPASPRIEPVDRKDGAFKADEFRLRGVADDLSSFTFQFSTAQYTPAFFPDEGFLFQQHSNLYQVLDADSGPNSRLVIVNRETNPSPGVEGPIMGGACGALLNEASGEMGPAESRSMSADGSVVYFSVADDPGPAGEICQSNLVTHLFKRIGNETTVRLSESECDRVAPVCSGGGQDIFEDASSDGSVTFFLSSAQLTDSDLDGESVTATATTVQGSSILTNVVTAKGTGTLTSGSDEVTAAAASSGEFAVGQTITGSGIPSAPATTITQIAGSTLTLSAPATVTGDRSLSAGAQPFKVGQRLSGPGISLPPQVVTVTAVSGQTVTMSGTAVSSEANATITGFAPCAASIDGCDLYRYDQGRPAGQRLTQVSAGETVAGHVEGAGARAEDVLGSSPDGTRVYFVARGVLTGPNADGAAPVAGQRNVYVHELSGDHPSGRIGFVATLHAADNIYQSAALPRGGPTPDGRYLLFRSAAALVAGDADASADVYRYDDEAQALECLSCAQDGAFGVNIPFIGNGDFRRALPEAEQRVRSASADVSTVSFVTAEPMLPADQNTAADVYLWKDGALALVSGGTGAYGVSDDQFSSGVSPDGKSVFFTTVAALAPEDTNGQLDLYAARIGGGFPARTARQVACVGDECHGPDAGVSAPVRPETSSSAGANVASGERRTLQIAGLSAKARRRAARSGRLALSIRTNRAGVLRVLARARIGKRTRRVAGRSVEVREAGVTRVGLRLSRPARRRLQSGRGLRLTIQVHSSGARSRSIAVRLSGASS